MLAQTLGWIATVLFTVCYIPQIAKTARSQTLDGLSVYLFIIQFVANVDALGYALLIGQRPLQIKYSAALVMLTVVLVTIYRLWRKQQRSSAFTWERLAQLWINRAGVRSLRRSARVFLPAARTHDRGDRRA